MMKWLFLALLFVSSQSTPYNPLNSLDWTSIDLKGEINPKFLDESNGFVDGDGVVFGFDEVGFEIRTYEANGNNKDNPGLGATHAQAVRCVPAEYADDIDEPNGQTRMSAREISNVIAKQIPEEDQKFVNERHLTQFAWQWGQFIDHDVTLISEATAAEVGLLSTEHIDAYVPCNDPVFDADQSVEEWCNADRHIEVLRTHHFPQTGADYGVQREQQNEITSFVDASMIYGSDGQRAAALRSNVDGKLLLDDDDYFGFLPDNIVSEENEPNSEQEYVLAGDVRPNEQLGLLTMHTIWVRFHNILSDEVADSVAESIDRNDPGFDEAVYQYTKLIVTAIVQKITYQDWLPTMFGETAINLFLGEYNGYDSTVDPGACLIFSSAAYRLGHTLLPQFLPLRNADCSFWTDFEAENCNVCDLELGGIELRNAFFVPQISEDNPGFFEALLNGYACTLANEIDPFITGGVRNFLFESAFYPPTSTAAEDKLFGDLDLITLNIQRAREHGLPDFNKVRELIGLTKHTEFSDLTSDEELAGRFEEIAYGDIDDLDMFLALLAEDHYEDGSFGETISAIVLGQFARFRDGDRFWYQDYIKPGELMDFINSMTLKSVVELTTEIDNIGSVDSVRHNIFQNSRAISIFDQVNNFEDDVFFAEAPGSNIVIDEESESVQTHHQYQPYQRHYPQPVSHNYPENKPADYLPHLNGPYVIQLTNMQIFVIFAGIIGIVLCTCFILQQCSANKRNRYRPVKYDTDSELDASDREKLQS